MEMMEVNSSDVTSSGMGENIGSGEMEVIEVNSSDVTSLGMGGNIGSDKIEVMEVNSSDVTVLVSRLYPFTNYTFYVLAITVTPSEPSDNVTVLTDEAGKNSYIFH